MNTKLAKLQNRCPELVRFIQSRGQPSRPLSPADSKQEIKGELKFDVDMQKIQVEMQKLVGKDSENKITFDLSSLRLTDLLLERLAKEVLPLEACQSVELLNLSNNFLNGSRPLVLFSRLLPSLSRVNLDQNPELNPELQDKYRKNDGGSSIREYLKLMEKSMKSHQVKLIFMGHGEAGKTTIMKSLLSPRNSTEFVDVAKRLPRVK